VREAFKEYGAGIKDEIASAIVGLFPELEWRLPPKRKIWTKEDFRLAIFDAVSAAIAFHKTESADRNAGYAGV